MKRHARIVLSSVIGIVCVFGVLQLFGHFLTRDFRERQRTLEPLLTTNAPLQDVIARTGVDFVVWRRDTAVWEQVLSQYRRGSKWDRHIAAKMEQAAAVGHASTIDMQTWIFLDQQDRLVGFELGSQ